MASRFKGIKRNNLLKCFLLCSFIVFFVSAAGSASTDNGTFSLGEIVVTAESRGAEGASSITEVTAADIESRNARNVGEALALVPGVHFRLGRSKSGHYVTMRGFEQEGILILLDGVPISVPYEGLVNLPDIPVQNIAKIKVIKGNASTLYGPNAIGGVINIITKKGGDEPQTTLAYKVSDYQTHHFSATQGGKLGNFRYFLGGAHQQSDGYNLARTFTLQDDVLASMAASPANPHHRPNIPPPPDSGKRENSDYTKKNLMFTGDLAFHPRHSLGLSMEYYNHEYGIPPVPVYREHNRGFFYFPRYWRFTDWERYTVNLIEESHLGDAFRIRTRVYFDDYENILNIYDDDTYTLQDRIGPPSGESVYKDYSAGVNSHLFWDVTQSNQLRLGLSAKKDVHKENFLDSPYNRLESQTYSIALEDELRIGDDLTLTLGCGYDKFNKRKREEVDNPDADTGKDLDTFSPLAGAMYDLTDDVSLFASYARKVRFPTMRNLYAEGVVGPQGNPDLKEEKADKYEVGGAWTVSPALRLESAVFYNDVKDLINFDNMLGRFEQYEKARIYGIEFNVSGNITDSLTGALGYTWLKTENRSTVTIENSRYDALVYRPKELPYRPEHKIDFDLRQVFSWGTRASLFGSYFSRQVFYDHADPANNKSLVADKKYLDEYVLVNLKISHPITSKVDIELAGENLLNESYENIDMFPAAGITGWAGISIKL
jgi:iron complex outermembrane receptor protein/outer membrane receptor for ferrienterochelin and colicins